MRLPDLSLQRYAAVAYRYVSTRPHPSSCIDHSRNIHHSHLRCLCCKEHVCTRRSGRPSPCCSLQVASRLLPHKARFVIFLTRHACQQWCSLKEKPFLIIGNACRIQGHWAVAFPHECNDKSTSYLLMHLMTQTELLSGTAIQGRVRSQVAGWYITSGLIRTNLSQMLRVHL